MFLLMASVCVLVSSGPPQCSKPIASPQGPSVFKTEAECDMFIWGNFQTPLDVDDHIGFIFRPTYEDGPGRGHSLILKCVKAKNAT